MKQILIFLGSGASVPFGLPPMKKIVQLFEQKLERSTYTNKEVMMRLYGSIKEMLFDTYDYVDLESVFTVLQSISQRMKYSDLGYSSLFAVSKVIADPKLNIATEEEVATAKKLLRIYKAFVRRACLLKDTKETRITEVYSDFFEKLGSKYPSIF